MSELTPKDRAKLTSAIERFDRCMKRDDWKVWIGDDPGHAPLPPKVLTARDIYKQAFGVDMPDSVTATWEGSTVTFETHVPAEELVSFFFRESDE